MNERLILIASLAQAALQLTGQERAAQIAQIVAAGAAEFQEITGSPIDLANIPYIDPIAYSVVRKRRESTGDIVISVMVVLSLLGCAVWIVNRIYLWFLEVL